MENVQNDIQDYINGGLSGEALKQFEADMKANKSLAEEVDFYRKISFTMQNTELITMNKTLSTIRQSTNISPDFDIDPTFLPKNNTWKWWTIGILTVSLIGAFFLWQNQATKTRLLKAKTTSTEILHSVAAFEDVIGLDADDKSPLAQGMKFYDAGLYADAIPLLKTHYQRQPTDDFGKLYLAISYLMTGQSDKAVTLLEPMSNTSDIELADAAKWHLALALVQQGQLDKAKPLFIALQNHPRFGVNAQRMLQ
jgi:tetratricopeptide (TPR) repeat protein